MAGVFCNLDLLFGNFRDKQISFCVNTFNDAIKHYGRKINHYITIKCPCVDNRSSYRSDCRNCGGRGFVYIKKNEEIVLADSLSQNYSWDEMGEVIGGGVNISASGQSVFAIGDVLEFLDEGVYKNELSLGVSKVDGSLVLNTIYKVYKVLNAYLFQNVTTELTAISLDNISIEEGVVTINNLTFEGDTYISLRYAYCPVFRVANFDRETVATTVIVNGKERVYKMPIRFNCDRLKTDHYPLITISNMI